MHDTPGMQSHTTAAKPKKRGRGLVWTLIVAALAFGAGFGWQYYEADRVRDQLDATRQELAIERLRVRLGQAAIAAQAGEFEAARQQMSDFFTRLSAVADQLPDEMAAVAGEILATRDDVITGLSRANDEYAAILYDMLDRFRTEEAVPVGAGRPESTGAADVDEPGAAVGDTAG